MKYNPITRRLFLQGLGKTALALPLLPSLMPRETWGAELTPQARFVFMGHYFGRDMDHWYPKEEPSLVSPEGIRYLKLSSIPGNISYSLAPLNAIRNKITVIRGLDSLDSDNGHTWSQPLTAGGTNPSVNFGYSLDAILEESAKFNKTMTKVAALRTCPNLSANEASFSFTSKSVYGQRIPAEWNPKTLYDRYFNPITLAQAKPANDRKMVATGKVMEDFKRVMNSREIASDDRRRLDNYMTLLSSVEQRLGLALPNCKMPEMSAPATHNALHTATIDLEVAALACGLTNVVAHTIFQYAEDPKYNDENHHAAAHQNGGIAAPDGSPASMHAFMDRWVMGRVAEMLTKLDAVDDGGGKTLLDNTFFLYGNGESRGFHVHFDMPVIVAGGQGKLRLGHYMDFRPYPLNLFDGGKQLYAGRPYNDLLVTMAKAMGLQESDYQKFGQVGFGVYQNFDKRLKAHYQPFLNARNTPMPFLYTG